MKEQNDRQLSQILREWQVERAPETLESRVWKARPNRRRFSKAVWSVAAAAAVALVAVVTSGAVSRAQNRATMSEDGQLLFEAEMLSTRTTHGPSSSRYWLRKHTDGTITTTMTMHGLSFLTMSRTERPDGSTESSMDFLPIAFGRQKRTPHTDLIQRSCRTDDAATILRSEEIQGFQTWVLSRSYDGKFLDTAWRAPELGCQLLRHTFEQVQPDGTRKQISETHVAWMRRRAEPPK